MLNAIDPLPFAALKAAIGGDFEIAIGTSDLAASDPARPRISVLAIGLGRRLAAIGDEDSDHREAAVRSQRVFVGPSADDPQRFGIPGGAAAISGDSSLGDVIAPPGRLLAQGDGYAVEGDAICTRVQPPPVKLLIEIRGAAARGFVERVPASVAIDLAVWAQSSDEANRLLGLALAATHAVVADIDWLALNDSDLSAPTGRFAVAWRKPLLKLAGIERRAEPAANTSGWREIAHLELHGELEQALMLGAPDATGIIEQIACTLTRGSARAAEGGLI